MQTTYHDYTEKASGASLMELPEAGVSSMEFLWPAGVQELLEKAPLTELRPENPPHIFTYDTSLIFQEIERQEERANTDVYSFEAEAIAPADTSIFQEVEKLLKQLRNQGVLLEDVDEIQAYLRDCPDLIAVVPKAVEAVRRHLPDAQLALEVYHDPEIEDSFLVIYVRMRKYDGSVMDKIEQAESEYLDLLANSSGWLQLTTDFRYPVK